MPTNWPLKISSTGASRVMRLSRERSRHASISRLAALSERLSQLVNLGRANRVTWTRNDTERALAQGWSLFIANGNKVMRICRFDGVQFVGVAVEPRKVFCHRRLGARLGQEAIHRWL